MVWVETYDLLGRSCDRGTDMVQEGLAEPGTSHVIADAVRSRDRVVGGSTSHGISDNREVVIGATSIH